MRICKESSNSRHCSDRCQTEVFSGAQGGGSYDAVVLFYYLHVCLWWDEMRWDGPSFLLFCFRAFLQELIQHWLNITSHFWFWSSSGGRSGVGLESQLIDADHILLKVLCPHPQPHLNQLLLAVAGLKKKRS